MQAPWIYKIVFVPNSKDYQDTEAVLNHWAERGWELDQVCGERVILKRRRS